jgi:tetratricopeptide (TPR) repeat protein
MDEHRRRHEMPEAEATAAEAVARFPDSVDISIAYGRILLLTYRAEEAAQVFLRAEQLAPQNDRPAAWRVAALSRQRLFDEAIAAGIKATERLPNSSLVRVALGRVFLDSSRPEQALEHFARAATTAPHDIRAINWHAAGLAELHRWPEAQTVIRKAIERDPAETKLYFQLGWILIDDCSREAIEYFDIVLNRAPQHPQALEWRSTALRNLRRFSEAEEATAGAIRLLPRCPRLYVEHAWVSSDQDREDEAVTRVDGALAIDPRHSWALRSRMNFLQWARRFEEAEQAAAEAIELSPKDSGIRVELGRMKDYRREFEPALLCLAIVLARDPDHVEANVAKSAVLRSMRRCAEARREITRLSKLKPEVRELKFELGQIHHDERRLVEARKVFRDLLATAANADEHAEAHHSLGWVAFTETDFITAEQEFRAAIEQQPGDLDYELALAWALTRQGGRRREEEAEQIATKVVERRPDPSAHVCLGVLAFKRGGLAASEYHLNQALQIDPWHGSHTDLGALYSHIGRYDDAESELRQAVTRDWYDTVAHVELGRLFLQLGEQRLPDAEREFRQALACDPTSSSAAIGLAQALEKAGDEIAAESTLRQALRRQEAGDTWRTFLALARLLVQRGDKQQNSDLLADAYAQAQRAIGLAPDAEADPHFVAGVALHRLGSLSVDARGRLGYRRRAMNHLRECVKRDEGHADAQRNLSLLEREMKVTAPAVWGGYAVAGVSLTLLAVMWVMFFLSTKVTAVLLSVTTPVLVGLFTIATLLPTLIRLRLPGFEADLQAGTGVSTPGPTGDVTFSPGRFSAPTGPTGQPPPRK